MELFLHTYCVFLVSIDGFMLFCLVRFIDVMCLTYQHSSDGLCLHVVFYFPQKSQKGINFLVFLTLLSYFCLSRAAI